MMENTKPVRSLDDIADRLDRVKELCLLTGEKQAAGESVRALSAEVEGLLNTLEAAVFDMGRLMGGDRRYGRRGYKR